MSVITHKPGIGGSNPPLATNSMNNILIFCLTLKPEHEKIIKKLSLIPVGLGKSNFSSNFFTDKTGDNIAQKNPFYGEYTFHYWIWKNYLNKINTDWVGFCQYRKFFVKESIDKKNLNFEKLKKNLFIEVDSLNNDVGCVLGNRFSVENYKLSKILKHHLFHFLSKPSLFMNKKKRNLKLHFDLFHGKGNLDLAINLLDKNNRNDFKNFMNEQKSFNPHNMFLCRKELLEEYYSVIFPWLEKCEKIFKFENLNGYGLQRIYGFLAERFLSYWFTKNSNHVEMPIIVKDLSDYKDL